MRQHRFLHVDKNAGIRGMKQLLKDKRYVLSILAAAGLLSAATFSSRTLGYVDKFPWMYSFLFVFLFFLLLLPRWLFFVGFALALTVVGALNKLNETKIALVGLPVTFFDMRNVVKDPSVLANALGLHAHYSRTTVLCTLLGILLTALFVLYRRHKYTHPDVNSGPSGPSGLSNFVKASVKRLLAPALNAVAAVIVLIATQSSLGRYGEFVHATLSSQRTKLWEDLWSPAAQVALSRELGVLGYWGFAEVAGHDLSDEVAEHASRSSVSEDEIRRAASQFVNVSSNPDKALPNIVLLQAESTFDPNITFRLSSRIELDLWSRNENTRALGPLRVNVVGGGSWVTEFEVMVGADSRLFGYLGYYTNYLLTPKVKISLAKYLASKGYASKAFYPAEGSFYNTDKAYRHYGFAEFVDGTKLNLPTDWSILLDREIVAEVVRQGFFRTAGPFFYFIVTSENHGPHPCRHFRAEREFVTTFSRVADFQANCQLNEYIKRARSTSDAFRLILQKLVEIEGETGRPFVLMVYGDHQPWSFTDGAYSIAGGTATERGFQSFPEHRRGPNQYETMFHLVSSRDGIVKRTFPVPPPVSMIPTLLSAFVAGSYEDLYLPINFYAYATCGSDIKAKGCEAYSAMASSVRTAVLVGAAANEGARDGRALSKWR